MGVQYPIEGWAELTFLVYANRKTLQVGYNAIKEYANSYEDLKELNSDIMPMFGMRIADICSLSAILGASSDARTPLCTVKSRKEPLIIPKNSCLKVAGRIMGHSEITTSPF